jgi:DNA polymerase bacteriophage-type
MITLRIDLETYSSVDLKKCGVHKYAESDDFEIMLFGFKYGDGPAAVYDLANGEEVPEHIMDALTDPTILKTAYNAAFEMACIGSHFGQEFIKPEQWRCTSVHALYLGLPGNLADVGRVVGIEPDKQKMAVGWSLIRYFCIPCKPTKINGGRTRNRAQHDRAKWQLFKDYCLRDVESEHEIAIKLAKFPVPEVEWQLWHLDHRMMMRGVMLDTVLIDAAIECSELFKERLTNQAIRLTGLDNPNSRNQLLKWLQEEEEDDTILDLTKKNVPTLLANTDSEIVHQVLMLRQELAKTSVTKFNAMARAVCKDQRVRGLTQFYGANRTGRWAGRIVQVQNLPKNELRDLNLARDLVKMREFDTLAMMFGTVPDTLSQLIRTAFIASPGATLLSIDFSAIEARVIAWLAWCMWRLDVFKTHGKIYEASAEQMFKLPAGTVDKKSPYRQKGKIAELALGYQGGVGALTTMGALNMGLTEAELDPIKVAWREANPEIVKLWYSVERAAKQAVTNKTSVALEIAGHRSKLFFRYESGFLTIQLPSGRKLFYIKPRIENEDLVRENSKTGGHYIVASVGSLTYEGQDQKTKQWTRLATYGGKLVENITQAIARDCLRESMLALDEAGHEQLFTVHDEIIIETNSADDLPKAEEIMGRSLSWAPGLPLRADGFATPYYMKEID